MRSGLLLPALLMAGWQTVAVAQPQPLADAIQRIETDDASNLVLNQLQAATLALDLGLRDDSAQLFDDALAGVTAVYADNERAAAARGLWRNEGAKDYKGEPYERAMAFYYRGLLDMYAGDYENARASFKSGLLQDAFAEEAQHRADFALLMFLEGWSSHVLGAKDLASERFAEVQGLRPALAPPDASHNVLVIVETGKAPRKLQDGIGGNMLVYRQGKRFTEAGARLTRNGQTIDLLPMESIFWQASTRGGRPIDSILDGQVQFKQTTQTVSANVSGVASNAASFAPLFGAAGGAFAGVAAVAGIATLATAKVTARADNRFWNNLPDMVHVHTMAAPKGEKEVRVDFVDGNGTVLPELSQTAAIHFDDRGRGLVWVRSRRATEVDTK